MTFLELELFQERFQFIVNRFHAVQGPNLFIPLVEIGEMRRDGPFVHGHDLVDLAEHDKVDDRELRARQILMLFQLLVELHNDLLFELVLPDLEPLLHLGVVLFRCGLGLEHAHHQTSDQLAGVATDLAVEVARDGCDSLHLALVVVDALGLLVGAQEPLEQSEAGRQHAIPTLHKHRNRTCWTDCFVFCCQVLLS